MESVTKFIDSLLVKNRVTLKMVYDCSVNDREIITDIKKIFDLENKQAFLLCLVALRILGENEKNKIAEYFKNDSQMYYDLDDQFFEENKTVVLTAFIYNPEFFTMAVNMRGLIEHELQKQKNLKIMPKNKKSPPQTWHFEFLAASSAGPKWKPVGEPLMIKLKNGIDGRLSIYGKDLKGKRVALFRFAFAKYYQCLPFYLDITFITKADNLTHKAKLGEKYIDNPKMNELVITSSIQDKIDFSGGINVTEIREISIG